MTAKTMEELVSLCKRRGFLFQSNDIYGGIKGLYDYGPMGVEFKNNLKQAWWKSMVYERDDTEGLDASILSSPVVLKHSGHEDTFTDPLVDCRACKSRWRADQLFENNKCPNCKSEDLTEPRPFNLMFKTAIGPVDDGSSFAYLRPETCQQIFTNFKNILDSTSRTVPFGIAQMGKAFRNEITPRNFIFRVREFEQMELEFFVKPGTDDEWHEYWINKRIEWWVNQGIKKENLKKIEVEKNELAHYSKRTVDINYVFPHGEEELEGVANRTDFDLGSHTKNQNDFKITSEVMKNSSSTTKLAVQDLEEKKWYIPYVIEPSAGVDRGVLALLNEAYREENVDKDNKGWILDGYPRNLSQANSLNEVLAEINQPLEVVFYLDIPEEVLIKRLLLRGRKDDTEETIRTRVDIYKKTTEPLIKYFKDLSLLEYIDADRDLKTISYDIKQKMA